MTCILSVEGSMPESPRSTEHECSFDEPVKSDQIETPDEAHLLSHPHYSFLQF